MTLYESDFMKKRGNAACALYLANLVGCSLTGRAPGYPTKECRWEDIFSLAGRNRVVGLTWHAVKFLEAVPENVKETWERVSCITTIQNLHYDAERSVIIQALSSEGIATLPLKGITLLDLYPSPDMRSMCDNDILYGCIERDDSGQWHVRGETKEQQQETMRKTRATLCEVMKGLGYSFHVEHDVSDCHDTKFCKSPGLVFEMHHSLAEDWQCDSDFYANPWRLANLKKQDDGNDTTQQFELSIDDQYLYCISHAKKHSIYAGLGIRHLADIYVLRAAMGSGANSDYVRTSLKKMGISDFEQKIAELSDCVIRGLPLSDSQENVLIQMVEGGVFGSNEERMAGDIALRKKTGSAHPYIDFFHERLSPDSVHSDVTINAIAKNELLRHLFPIIKLLWYFWKALRHPVQTMNKLKAILSNKNNNE